jgi:hypothetical protein
VTSPARGRAAVLAGAAGADLAARVAGAGNHQPMTERDPANPTPEELEETARSEGLAATEEETDPRYGLEDDEPEGEPPPD